MKALILDGSNSGDTTAERVSLQLQQELTRRGWEYEVVILREKKIGNCAGDFFCWVKTPGICNINDDNRMAAGEIIASDLLVYLTPITFGGYSSTLKSLVDHQIQNVLPFFTQINGETHHQKRYDRYPDFLVLGWLPGQDEKAEAIFSRLTRRNALNFYAERSGSCVLYNGQTETEIHAKISGSLDFLNDSPSINAEESIVSVDKTQESLPFVQADFPVKRALLLVGSPRTKNSTSYSLGGYLIDQLAVKSIETQTIFLHTILRSAEKKAQLLQAVEQADLFILAYPLYIDTLPAPVIETLELISDSRAEKPAAKHALFTAIANCGFPEASHTDNSLAVCELFARQAGFTWAGSLALGAGEGLVHGVPLKDAGGPALLIKQSLNLAADALSKGQSIPHQAGKLLSRSIIPGWLYRMMGSIGWVQSAKKFGVQKLLKRKTYFPSN